MAEPGGRIEAAARRLGHASALPARAETGPRIAATRRLTGLA